MVKIQAHQAVSALAASVAFASGGQSANAEAFTLRIASGHTEGFHFVEITRDFFVPEVTKRVAERTDHTVIFIEGWGGSFVKATEVLEGTQGGIVDFGVLCYCLEGDALPMQNFPYFLPFGPSDSEISVAATRRVHDQFPQFAENLDARYNQRLLALLPLDNYDIISSFPIESGESVIGRRVGGAGPNLAWVETMGALPVTAVGAELYTSLQTGVYDSLIAFASIMNSLRLYEVAEYYVRVGFGSMTSVALHANSATIDRLPPEVVDIIVEVASEMEDRGGAFTNEVYAENLAQIESNGGTIIDVPEEARVAWSQALADLPARSAADADIDGDIQMTELLTAYIAAAEAEGYVWPLRYQLD